MVEMNGDVESYAMKSLPSVVTAIQHQDSEFRVDSKTNRDEIELAYFGKRQQLKVGHPRDPRCHQNVGIFSLISSCVYRGVSVLCLSLDLRVH